MERIALPEKLHIVDGQQILDCNEAPTQLQLFKQSETTRPDVNVGKFAGIIFSSPWSKNLYETRSHEWEVGADGGKTRAAIHITPLLNRKRPTTTTYRVFLALIQIWEQLGKPESGKLLFSSRQLAGLLNWRWSGTRTPARIHEQLDILSGTEIKWIRSFRSGDVLETLVEDMKLIESKSYLERKAALKAERFTAQQTVRLNAELVQNMLAGKTKPINYKAFLSIKNDSSANLYTLLDIYLSKKTKWERRSHGLLTVDLDFAGQRYEERYNRHAKLKAFVKELHGKELSSGTLQLSIAETADGLDYKLVARKLAKPKSRSGRKSIGFANPKEDIPLIADDLIEGLNQIRPTRATRGTIELLAKTYPKEMLFRVLAMLKADYRDTIKTSPIRAFMYNLHVEVHRRNLDWISSEKCGPECSSLIQAKRGDSNSPL